MSYFPETNQMLQTNKTDNILFKLSSCNLLVNRDTYVQEGSPV